MDVSVFHMRLRMTLQVHSDVKQWESSFFFPMRNLNSLLETQTSGDGRQT